jgi:hypothetical protein
MKKEVQKGEGVELGSANTLSLIVTLGTYYIIHLMEKDI